MQTLVAITTGSIFLLKLLGILTESKSINNYSYFGNDEFEEVNQIKVKFNVYKALETKELKICYKGKLCSFNFAVDDDKWLKGGDNITFTTEMVKYWNKDEIKERKWTKLSFEFELNSYMKKVYFAYCYP